MSALSKPGIYLLGAVAPQDTQLIPAEYVQNVDKLTLTASPLNNNTAEYWLLFTSVNAYRPVIKIKFSDSTKRDFAYTTVKTTIGASIAAS